jgi:transposase-like protein
MAQGHKKEETKATKRGRGRPSTYSQDLVEEICLLISEDLSVRKICERQGLPERRTIYRWLAQHDEFRHQYARARELQADYLFDECLDIADEAKDLVEIQRARLRIDARKWMAGKLAPKKYGDKVTQEISGLERDPVRPTIILSELPPESGRTTEIIGAAGEADSFTRKH